MQVRDSIKNRRNYGLLGLICLFIQLAIVPHIGLGNGRANMALVFAALVAMQTGGRTGVFCGFISGLLFDLSTTGPIGLMAGLLTVCAYLMGTEERNLLGEGFTTSMVAFAVAATVVTLMYHTAMLLVGDASGIIDVVFYRSLPTLVLTLIAFAPFAWVMSHGSGRPLQLGGKGSKPGHGRGSRYDLGNI